MITSASPCPPATRSMPGNPDARSCWHRMSSAASGVVLGVALLVASGPVMAGDAVGELRDRGGRLLGTVLEADDRFLVARDCRGRLVGRYDRHTRQSRDARGILVGSGNWLARLIPECAN